MNDSPDQLISLSKIGEFALIDRIASRFRITEKKLIKGIGDDAAVLDNGEDFLLLTTDQLVEGVHFDLSYTPLKHLGYKSVVINLSDIYAMNGIPHSITVSFAASNRFTLQAIDELYAGIKIACDKYHVSLAGGDTSSSRKGLFLSVTALGSVKKDRVVFRNGAQVNDLICVTNDPGAAYAGLLILEREKKIYAENPSSQPELASYEYVISRFLKPEAQQSLIDWFLKENIIPTSMIDVSDGLASEILHITRQSHVGSVIYEEKMPRHENTLKVAMEFQMDTNSFIFNGGEDYEMLFTIPLSLHEKIAENTCIHVIGYIAPEEEGNKMISRGGQVVPITALGWNHFSDAP